MTAAPVAAAARALALALVLLVAATLVGAQEPSGALQLDPPSSTATVVFSRLTGAVYVCPDAVISGPTTPDQVVITLSPTLGGLEGLSAVRAFLSGWSKRAERTDKKISLRSMLTCTHTHMHTFSLPPPLPFSHPHTLSQPLHLL